MAILGRSFCQREPHLKTGIARFRIDLNIPPVLLHDPLNRIEAKPRTLPTPLGVKESRKKGGFSPGENSGTLSPDLTPNTAFLALVSTPNLPFSPHRSNGMANEVGQT